MPRTSNSAVAFEPSVAVYDACILYPFHLRNIVVQIAVDRLVEARWTDEIHDEWLRRLVANMPAIPIERLQITRRLMNDALPSAMVAGYKGYIQTDRAPDLILASLANARRNLSKTRVSASAFVNILKSQRLIQLSARIAEHLTDL
jgi:hypothetical protein